MTEAGLGKVLAASLSVATRSLYHFTPSERSGEPSRKGGPVTRLLSPRLTSHHLLASLSGEWSHLPGGA